MVEKKINIKQLKEDINLIVFNHFGTEEMKLSNDIFNALEEFENNLNQTKAL